MRNPRLVGLVAAVAVAAGIGCGKSESQKQAEQAAEQLKQAAESLEKATGASGEEAARTVAGLAKAMEGMAGAMAGGDGTVADPVSFTDLQATLPFVSGWTMDKPRGERMTAPVKFSQVEATYEKDGQQVEVKIVDSAFSQMLMAPWSMFLAAGYERTTSEGYEKAVTLGGHPGFEKWNAESKSGELNVVVAKRFLVTIDGDAGDPAVLRTFFENLDAAKLAGLK